MPLRRAVQGTAGPCASPSPSLQTRARPEGPTTAKTKDARERQLEQRREPPGGALRPRAPLPPPAAGTPSRCAARAPNVAQKGMPRRRTRSPGAACVSAGGEATAACLRPLHGLREVLPHQARRPRCASAFCGTSERLRAAHTGAAPLPLACTQLFHTKSALLAARCVLTSVRKSTRWCVRHVEMFLTLEDTPGEEGRSAVKVCNEDDRRTSQQVYNNNISITKESLQVGAGWRPVIAAAGAQRVQRSAHAAPRAPCGLAGPRHADLRRRTKHPCPARCPCSPPRCRRRLRKQTRAARRRRQQPRCPRRTVEP